MFEILFGWRKASKCKHLIKCVRCRLKLLRSKRDAIVRQLRDDVAQLLKKGQDESAFARVEQLFKDQNMLEAYVLLDQFCEFIIINLPYIRRNRDCPNDLNEAISSLIFASARCADLPELQTLRTLFSKRYGNNFAVAAVELFPGNHVSQQITEKLCRRSISYDVKLSLIDEIAEEYNLNLGRPEVEDSWNPVFLQVYHPSIQDSDFALEKQVSGKDIQVIFGDTTKDEVPASNDKEMLQIYQRHHLGHMNLQQEKAGYHFSSNCDKLVQNSSHCHDSSSVNSNSNGASVVDKCVSRVVPPLNSPAISTFMQEVNQISKSDPSYERIFVHGDDAESSCIIMQDYNESEDERTLVSTNSLQNNTWRQTCELKITSQNRLDQQKVKIGIMGSYKEGKQKSGGVNCEDPSKASRSISDLDLYNCAQKLEESSEFHDGSVSSRRSHKRRKSVTTSSRRQSISRQGELHDGCADIHEFGDFCGTSRRLPGEIHHQWDCSSMLALCKKDMEFALCYDESCGDSDIVDLMQENSCFHRIKPNGDYFSREHHRHSSSNLADGLCVRSRLCRRKHQKEITSGSGKLHPCPQCHYAPKSAGGICFDVLVRRASTGHGYRRRSCSSIHDCCLEHACYSFASESSSPNQSCVTALPGSPHYDIQLQEQEYHCCCQCYSNCNEFNHLSKTIHQIDFACPENEKASSVRQCMDSGSDMDISNDSTLNNTSAQSSWRRINEEVKREASVHCDSNTFSHVSCSTEIPPPSSESRTAMRPPYLRAVTMPLPERSKITVTNQTSRSTSFQLQQANCHVHPKLPDYDDLAAKFMALKKEHLQNTARRACNG